jgi:hypothetical protein
VPNVGKNRKNDRYRRHDRRKQVARLYLRGSSQTEIAHQLGCSQPTVSNDLAAIRRDWLASATRDVEEATAQKLAEYAEAKKEAWRAWDKSKEDFQRRGEEIEQEHDCPVCEGSGTNMRGGRCKSCDGTGAKSEVGKVTQTTEGQCGNPSYLRVVLECLEAERELLGLDPAKEVSVKGRMQVATINWKLLAAGIPEGPVPDIIEEEIQKALGFDVSNKETLGLQGHGEATALPLSNVTNTSPASDRQRRSEAEAGP